MAANINSVNFAGSPGTLIVDPVAGKGQFTTIAAAVADAGNGDTIYVRPGTYTENFTIGANIAIVGATSGSINEQEVTIIGKITVSSTFYPVIENIKLSTNSDYCISNTSTGRPVLRNCFILANSIAAVQNSSTGSVYFYNCTLSLIGNSAFYSNSSTGSLIFEGCTSFASTSTTASDTAGTSNFFNSYISFPLSTSGAGTVNGFSTSFAVTSASVTISFTGTGVSEIANCFIKQNTSLTVMTCGAGTRLNITDCGIHGTGADAITGAGRIDYAGLSFYSANTITVTTQVPKANIVKQGGTGVTSQAAYSLVAGGTTTTGAFQAIAPVATGQVLTSAGTGALPAFSASPSVTSITLSSGTALDHYVEGSWPVGITIGGSSLGITYAAQVATYTRIGNIVIARYFMQTSSLGGLTGDFVLTGLPLPSVSGNNGFGYAVSRYSDVTFTGTYTSMFLLTASSTSTATIQLAGSGNTPATLNNTTSTVGNGFLISGMFMYTVNL